MTIPLNYRQLIEQHIYFHSARVTMSEFFLIVIINAISHHNVGITFSTKYLTTESAMMPPDQEGYK